VTVAPGDHIKVRTVDQIDHTTYIVSSEQWPAIIDPDNSDILYGDGTPCNPLGVYDFDGATATEDGKPGTVPAPKAGEEAMFLCGDGTWKEMGGVRPCTAEEMDEWIDEVNDG
jgi:hypothetical protein